MIIRRYISLQVLASTGAVALVLTVILMSGRAIKYFALAADGRMDVKMLTAVLLYRLPGFLDIIIPLGLFIAVLLTFGRLYLDNEMSVLHASGVSRAQIVSFLALPAVVVMAVVSFTSLYLTPEGVAAAERIFAEQAQRNTFDLVRPGRFQPLGERIFYAEALSPDRQRLLNVHFLEQKPVSASDQALVQVMVSAASARTERTRNGERYLILEHGARYELVPGRAATREFRFESYRLRLPEPVAIEGLSKLGLWETARLWREKDHNPLALGEWLWRLSMPLFVPVAMLLGFALSRVNPRQGRYLKLLPAIMLYMSYVVAVGAARNAVDKGRASELAVWGVHLGYLLFSVFLLGSERLQIWRRRWRSAKEARA